MTQRDIHRARVYEAESQVLRMLDRAAPAGSTVEFFGSTLTLPVERRFGDVASVQRFVDAVLALEPVRVTWPEAPPVTVRGRRGQRAAHYESGGVIAVPVRSTWALREMVVCHELAHHLARSVSADERHGPVFTDAYSRLVGMVLGPEVELLLRAGLDRASVPVGVRR